MIWEGMLSRVPNLAARQAVKAHYDFEEPDPYQGELADIYAQIREIEKKHHEAREAETAPLRARQKELWGLQSKIEEERYEKFEDAINAQGIDLGDFQMHEDYCGVSRCAISGLPLMDGDVTGTTPGGEEFLWCLMEGEKP